MRRRERITSRVAIAIALAICTVAAVAIMGRFRHGIDFTDEAFYVSLPIRFVLGDRPFVDELNIAQTSGLLLYPILKVYYAIRGTTGIFLFIRVLYLLFFGCVGAAAAALGRRRLPWHAAILAGSPAIAFVPYAIPGLSYNTLGSGLLGIGLFVVASALLAPVEDAPPKFYRDRLVWGGFALGAAAFAYPSLVIGAAAATGATFVLASGRRFLATARVILGGATFGLVVLPVFAMAGPAHVRQTFAYSGGGGMTITAAKFTALWNTFLGQHPEWSTLAVATAVAIALSRKWPRLVALGLPFLPLISKDAVVGAVVTTLGYVSSISLIGPLVGLALRDTRAARVIVVGVWVPSAISGAAMGWTSGNGVIAAGVGLLPAAIASTLLLTMWITELVRTVPDVHLRSVFGFAPAFVLLTMVKLTLANDAVYRDGSLTQLTALVTDGPYKGLYTTSERKRSLATMSKDIIQTATSQRTLFYYDFPVGYLITKTRPLVPSTWIFEMEPRLSMDAAYFNDRAAPGDVVFKIGGMSSLNPIDRHVMARAQQLDGRRDGYTAWVVR